MQAVECMRPCCLPAGQPAKCPLRLSSTAQSRCCMHAGSTRWQKPAQSWLVPGVPSSLTKDGEAVWVPPSRAERVRGQQATLPVPHRQPPVAGLPCLLAGVGGEEEQALTECNVHGAGARGLLRAAQGAGAGSHDARGEPAAAADWLVNGHFLAPQEQCQRRVAALPGWPTVPCCMWLGSAGRAGVTAGCKCVDPRAARWHRSTHTCGAGDSPCCGSRQSMKTPSGWPAAGPRCGPENFTTCWRGVRISTRRAPCLSRI